MKHTVLFLGLFISAAFSAGAHADPTCRDYPAFLQCVKGKQGTWPECRERHCEGGETSLRADGLQESALECEPGSQCQTIMD